MNASSGVLLNAIPVTPSTGGSATAPTNAGVGNQGFADALQAALFSLIPLPQANAAPTLPGAIFYSANPQSPTPAEEQVEPETAALVAASMMMRMPALPVAPPESMLPSAGEQPAPVRTESLPAGVDSVPVQFPLTKGVIPTTKTVPTIAQDVVANAEPFVLPNRPAARETPTARSSPAPVLPVEVVAPAQTPPVIPQSRPRFDAIDSSKPIQPRAVPETIAPATRSTVAPAPVPASNAPLPVLPSPSSPLPPFRPRTNAPAPVVPITAPAPSLVRTPTPIPVPIASAAFASEPVATPRPAAPIVAPVISPELPTPPNVTATDRVGERPLVPHYSTRIEVPSRPPTVNVSAPSVRVAAPKAEPVPTAVVVAEAEPAPSVPSRTPAAPQPVEANVPPPAVVPQRPIEPVVFSNATPRVQNEPLPTTADPVATERLAIRAQQPTTALPIDRPVSVEPPSGVEPARFPVALTNAPSVRPMVEEIRTPDERPVEPVSESTFDALTRAVVTGRPNEPQAPEQSAPSPTSSTPVQPVFEQVAEAFVRHARSTQRGDTTEFAIELNPRELGPVRVELIASPEGLRANLVVADEAIRQLVEGQLHLLRQRLADSSTPVVSFTVTDSGRQHQHAGQQHQWRQPEPGPAVAPAPRLFGTSTTAARTSDQRLDVMA